MPRDTRHTAYLSLRITPSLWLNLKRAADLEANTASAVARRLIATGLAREQRATEHDTAAGTERSR